MEVVSSFAYAQKKFGTAASEEVDGDDDDTAESGVDDVKQIIEDDTGFWTNLTHVLRICTPIVVLLRLMDGRKPCIGKIYDRMFMISQHIEKYKHVDWVKQVEAIHAAQWEYLHSYMHAAAYALDPEFLNTEGGFDSATQEGLLKVVERICLRDVMSEAPASERAAITMLSPKVQDRIATATGQLARYQQKEGNFSKPYVLSNARSMAPHVWWDTYGKHLPELASVAKRVLAQPCSASAAERNWSVYGMIKGERLTALGHAKADRRVFCHEALHMKETLQSARYVNVPERWDEHSDTDSNCSNDQDENDISQLVR